MARKLEPFAEHELARQARRRAAMVDGRHYTEHVPEVKALLKSKDDDAAAGILLRLIEAIEREATIPLAGVPGVPDWYFTNLAAIYRRVGNERARSLLMQRYALLDAKAQTDGAREMARLSSDVPGARATVREVQSDQDAEPMVKRLAKSVLKKITGNG